MKNSLKSITRAVTCFARRTGEIEAVRINGVVGFAMPNGSFHAVNEPLYACLLRQTNTGTRREWLAAARIVRGIDRDMGRALP